MSRFRVGMRLLLALPAATVLCIGIIGWLAVRQAQGLLIETERARVADLAESRAKGFAIVDWVILQQATELAQLPAVVESLEAGGDETVDDEVTAALTRLVRTSEVVASASIIDATGTIVESSDNALVGEAVDAPAFDDAEPGMEPEPETELRLEERAYNAHAAVMVDGELLGTVQISLLPALVDRIDDAEPFGETGEVVFLQSGDDEAALQTLGSTTYDRDTLVAAALHGETGRIVAEATEVPGYDLVAVAAIDRDEVVASSTAVRNIFISTGIVLAILAAAGGRAVGRRLEASVKSISRAESRFTTMFASAPMVMIAVDADGIIRLANDRAVSVLGYDGDELIGLSVDVLVPERVRAGHAALRAGFVETGTSRVMLPDEDVVAVCKNGDEVPVEISLTPIDTDTGRMVIAVLVDLTHRKEAEAALRQRAEELTRSNRDLDDFAYVAAHDLKAPLRAMESLASFVREDHGHLLPEDAQADLAEIEDRGKKLTGQLNGLLQYARIGKDQAAPELIDVKELLDELGGIYLPATFSLDVQAGLPSITAPRAATELVFRNLLMNTVKHHDRDAGEIKVTGQVADDEVVFQVIDDGPGIPPEYREKVFQLFGTLQHDENGEAGSGLGLALIKRTLESHGGSIELLARTGRGTVFEIHWPSNVRAGRSDVREAAATSGSRRHANREVLV